MTSTKQARPRYRTKAEWAQAKADEYFALANERRFAYSNGSATKAARKFEQVRHLEAEFVRFQSMARRYRERGQ